ncbi:LacI family DNA-binding transcriptional regulator [Streptomyces winkii]|uniref:LacI family DNA-binding transcriptional regulator n=1 Tax=Streptomyces winkii TaxID=3051178 RepID=UPI0028D89058|nr:LacI family DNA-binding transcriptional regulator [Streptomyces sp. DSM 40971]
MVTMRDIATRCGVSISAVSLVLNDQHEGRVSIDTAECIRSATEELGYLPNLAARGLRTRQTRTLGLLSDGVASVPFSGQMLAGAQSTAWREGYVLLLVDMAGNPDLEEPAVRSLLQRSVEGLIVAVDYHREVDLPVLSRPVPQVILGGRPRRGNADWVVPDESAGARTATRHLIDAGHRRIAFCNVSAPAFAIAESLRREGYERALAEAGLGLDESLVVEAPEPNSPAARDPARRLLRRSDRPTAVFCFSDRLALGFYQVAAELGLEIPRDLSVVGFDNQQNFAENLFPGLTTVQLPHYQMGVRAAETAIARLRGDESEGPTGNSVTCPLVVRDSVAAPFGRTPRQLSAGRRTPAV